MTWMSYILSSSLSLSLSYLLSPRPSPPSPPLSPLVSPSFPSSMATYDPSFPLFPILSRSLIFPLPSPLSFSPLLWQPMIITALIVGDWACHYLATLSMIGVIICAPSSSCWRHGIMCIYMCIYIYICNTNISLYIYIYIYVLVCNIYIYIHPSKIETL